MEGANQPLIFQLSRDKNHLSFQKHITEEPSIFQVTHPTNNLTSQSPTEEKVRHMWFLCKGLTHLANTRETQLQASLKDPLESYFELS